MIIYVILNSYKGDYLPNIKYECFTLNNQICELQNVTNHRTRIQNQNRRIAEGN